MIKHAIAIAAALSLSACMPVKNPTPAEMAYADYGAPMTQEHANTLAHNFLQTALKDPYSADIACGSFQKAWMKDQPIFPKSLTYGYRLTCMVNSKNSYGGYTGDQKWNFLFRNGATVYVYNEANGTPQRVF